MYKLKDEFIFNGVDLSKYFIVTEINRDLTGNITNYLRDIPGKRGMLYSSDNKGSKTISIIVKLIDYDKLNVTKTKDYLNSILVTDKLAKLQLADEPGKYELAKLDGSINFKRLFQGAEIQLKFINPSGIFYSDEISTGTKNYGNVDTPFILKGTIQSDLVTILDNDTLDKVTIDAKNIGVGTTFRYESEWEQVFINNNLRMNLLYAESDSLKLKPGENNITTQGLSDVTIEHQKRWL